ncbi:aminotransferase class I/II-fold pyridoxal phosphate-dependent enzyme [Streptomyces virginiae]|uniref:aminotransferase class I/II-fold pyridoxal phosphate-dependent enzyme n=1 Tax=Streptomyces virginiae TaxID=1961 RepID=UPI0032458C40
MHPATEPAVPASPLGRGRIGARGRGYRRADTRGSRQATPRRRAHRHRHGRRALRVHRVPRARRGLADRCLPALRAERAPDPGDRSRIRLPHAAGARSQHRQADTGLPARGAVLARTHRRPADRTRRSGHRSGQRARNHPAPRADAGPAAPAPRQERSTWAAGTAVIDEFPEVGEFERRLDGITDGGAENPYFRVHQGNIRDTTVIAGRTLLSFGSYNYLGLSGHPAVDEAVHRAVDRYGTSVSASRVLSGERDLTVRLERALADFLGVGDCLALVSGHATNVTTIGHLVGPQDLVVHDALAHDSILQGCALSGAARRPFAHNDMGQLEHMLRLNRSRFRRVLIAVEGAYSMDGDLVDLPAVIELKKRYGALLMIDEAHSIGTVGERGRGVGEFFDVDRSDVDLWMGTLSKAFASCGGYLGGSARMVRWLRHTLPGFVYSVGLTPANAAAALAATELLTAQPERVRALKRNSELFLGLATAAGLATGSSAGTPIVPCVLGDSAKTLHVANGLFARGVVADPIFHPAVEEGQSRLRFFVTSEHREEDIRRAVSILAEEVAAAGR